MTSLGHHAAPSAAAPAAGASVALDALIAAHRGPIIPCSPFAHPDLLFGSFRGRAEMVLRNAWGIPVLRRDGPDPRQGDLDRWRAFYLREGAPAECVEFLNFIASKANQEGYATAFQTLPASQEAQGVVTDPALKDVLAAYNNASYVMLWLDTMYGQNVGNALNGGVVNMLAGKGTPADIVEAVKSAAAKG